ncbi:MAG: tetratricopeptide repeat protein, partial [Bacteroidota bacterium]
CRIYAKNFIITQEFERGISALGYSRSYLKEHVAELPSPNGIYADLHTLYGDIAARISSEKMRKNALKFYELAQSVFDTTSLEAGILLRKIGEVKRLLGEHHTVIQSFQHSLRLIPETACRERMQTLQMMGAFYYRINDSTRAFMHFSEARKLMGNCKSDTPDDQIFQLYYEAKMEQKFRNDIESSQRIFERAVIKAGIFNVHSRLLPFCYSGLGNLQFTRGFYADAKDTYYRYLIHHQQVSQDSTRIAKAYEHLGNCISRLGDHEEAIQHYNEGLKIFRNLNSSEAIPARSLMNYGQALINLRRYGESLLYLDSALNKYLANSPGDHDNIANTYYNIGLVHERKKEHQASLTNFRLAIRHFKLGSQDDKAAVALCYTLAARGYEDSGEFENAILYIDSARTYLPGATPYTAVTIAETQIEIGNIFSDQTRYLEACASFQTALELIVAGYRSKDIYSFPNIENAISRLQALDALLGNGTAFRRLYTQSRELKDLQTSLKSFELAIDLIRKIRQDHKNEGSKLLLSGSKRHVFESAVEVAYELYLRTKKKKYR